MNLNSNFVWFNQSLVESYIKKPNILITPYNESEVQSNFRFLSKWFDNIDNLEQIKDFHSIILPNSKFQYLSSLNDSFEKKFLNKFEFSKIFIFSFLETIMIKNQRIVNLCLIKSTNWYQSKLYTWLLNLVKIIFSKFDF